MGLNNSKYNFKKENDLNYLYLNIHFGIHRRFSHAHFAPFDAVFATAYNWSTI